ncbi:MAG: T9SS type A sorting domain-containing protein, partial [Bacteroidota bacterium]
SAGQRDIVTIKYDSPLKLNEQTENIVHLYPNPFTDFAEMKLDYENVSDISIRIIDMLGIEVRSEKLVDGKISRGNLKSGMYILQVFDSNGILGVSNIIIQD